MKKRHVIIIGGGASGMVAAITAARNGAHVTIIEQQNKLGKKILSTGNGKCNLTNEYMKTECFRGDDTSIVETVLQQFNFDDTLYFFESLGVLTKSRQGYIYPVCEQASAILDVLNMEVNRLAIHVMLNESVVSIQKKKETFKVKTNSSSVLGDVIILATGGKASPVLGSDGSGYTLSKQFGHTISPVVPALVQLKGNGTYFKQIAGVRTHAKVSIFVNSSYVASDVGELQLTNYGISGIPVFQISRFASKALYEKKKVRVDVDFLPTMNDSDFETFINQRKEHHSQKSAEDFFVGIFHRKLIKMFLKQAYIPSHIKVSEIREDKWQILFSLCKHFQIEIIDTNPFEQAQICAGGVKTSEINHLTMESNYIENLYIVGELMDVDGICGGYNLQWAWATGYISGSHASKGRNYDTN